ncbi:MAG: hypothetical protein L0Z62_41595 [Gemmataceae bacterium]|nr:hypothetical protein [Gemmataceae bacterium]
MDEDIVALLRLFEGRVPDRETHAWVAALAVDRRKWPKAHRVFDRVRDRTLAAIKAGDQLREGQYMFEEICLKSLYNETAPLDPFDPDSPHWITKCAIGLARQVGVPVQKAITVVAPGAADEHGAI